MRDDLLYGALRNQPGCLQAQQTSVSSSFFKTVFLSLTETSRFCTGSVLVGKAAGVTCVGRL